MTLLLLARHGQSTWNAEGRWQGIADPPLTELGREQAAELARQLAGERLDAIYSSDLIRARETAEIVATARGMTAVARHDLREIDIGEWSGLTSAENEQRFPEGWKRHVAGGDGWEHGEAHAAMSERILAAVTAIADAHPDETVLCVLHGGVIRAVLAHAEGISLAEFRQTRRGPANGAMSRITIEDGRFARLD